MNVYSVVCNRPAEIEAVRAARPSHILISYFYFKNKPVSSLIEDLGYRPAIMLDSGAYSAFTQGKNISLVDYMNYVAANKDHVDEYISLDVIGNARMSFYYWQLMNWEGFRPVPVFHYGDPMTFLLRYVETNIDRVALGGCVPVEDKQVVANWANKCINAFPDIKFHLLGVNHKIIREQCERLHSRDFSTWIMAAANGYPKSIPGRDRASRIARAIENLRSIKDTGQVEWGA
ncbi:hypothetical protein ACHHV8_09955 [Paenibacillus sp. TAB 01]|uniref:hypothetical protein n=1 Tax=Paenibacillus sp. TAB 01 TaxID=3368988 RepID=UPI0037528988